MSQRAWVLFVAISRLWGLPYLLIKVAIAELDPAVAVALGVAILNEPLTLATLGGFGLIIVGCWLSTRTGETAAAKRRLASAIQRS